MKTTRVLAVAIAVAIGSALLALPARKAKAQSRKPAAMVSIADAEVVVRITAKKFEYAPAEIRLKRGVAVVLELTSLDRAHGFSVPDLGLRAEVPARGSVRVRLVPERAGRFEFHCDVFCGSGHEEMTGVILIE
jgi:cytochrome c oxidase subunit 2